MSAQSRTYESMVEEVDVLKGEIEKLKRELKVDQPLLSYEKYINSWRQ